MISEDIKNRFVSHCNSCYFTMVAIDPSGKKVQIPPLNPQTEDEKKRFEDARKRKELRLKMKA